MQTCISISQRWCFFIVSEFSGHMRPFQQAEAALSSFLWTGLGALADSGSFYSAMVGQNMKQPANCRHYIIQYVSFWNWSGTQQNVSFQFWLRVDPKSTSASLVVLESETWSQVDIPVRGETCMWGWPVELSRGLLRDISSFADSGFWKTAFCGPIPKQA